MNKVLLVQVRAKSFEVFVSFLAVLSGVGQIARGEVANAPGEVLGAIAAWLWTGSYLVAGVITIVGIVTGRVALEGMGVTWLAGAITVNLLAIIFLFGTGSLAIVSVYIAAILTCVSRSWDLVQGKDIVLIDRNNE